MSARIIVADVLAGLASLEPESVQCVVTSPPYWGLRDYGVAGQLGLEATPREYLIAMRRVFRAVRRVLRKDGTLWLNMGDSYANDGKWGGETGGKQAYLPDADRQRNGREKRVTGLKPKDLVGMPWRLALTLQRHGWWLRSEIIWSKPNPMPESVQDRPTRSHEHLFLMTRRSRYYYDAPAIAEPSVSGQPLQEPAGWARGPGSHDAVSHNTGSNAERRERSLARPRPGNEGKGEGSWAFDAPDDGVEPRATRNARTVWTIATQAFPEAHFATFPEDLVEPCILAGSKRGDLVLDPFAGSGTVGLVADRLGRDFVGVELNPAYAAIAERRLTGDSPLFAEVAITELTQGDQT